MIQLEHLTKDFARVRALDDLNLHVPTGEIFGLLGPNGAGKSTTIRLLTGLLKPTWGRALINGINLAERPRYAKEQIGLVPDLPFLYERLSGREFIEFIAQLNLRKPAEFQPRLRELSELFCMSDWLDERIESYSQGMRQKTIITAALIHNPPILVLDEPFTGLDAPAVATFKQILQLKARAGGAVFLATNVLTAAQELCQRIGILVQGRLTALGTAEELRQNSDSGLESIFLRITSEQTIPTAGL